ncbi:MAG: TIGR03905 family TSCPD domain-containing protein, partial [Anaerovibrio sp.]
MSAFEYAPQGVCSRLMQFDIEDNKIHNLKVVGGCNGNLQGIGKLVEGMDIDEVISRVEGIR